MEEVVGVESAIQDALWVQVSRRRGDAERDADGRLQVECRPGRIDIAGTRIEARRPGQVAEAVVDQRHDQPVSVSGMRLQLAEHREQMRMRAGRHAGVPRHQRPA